MAYKPLTEYCRILFEATVVIMIAIAMIRLSLVEKRQVDVITTVCLFALNYTVTRPWQIMPA